MGWVHRLEKSVRRMRRGKFHLNPLKNGAHLMSDPIGHIAYRTFLSKHHQRRLTKVIDWGRFKKRKINKLMNRWLGGNNSASAYDYAVSSQPSYGYQYHGRTLGEMM